jgi:uncharacterized membrane protein
MTFFSLVNFAVLAILATLACCLLGYAIYSYIMQTKLADQFVTSKYWKAGKSIHAISLEYNYDPRIWFIRAPALIPAVLLCGWLMLDAIPTFIYHQQAKNAAREQAREQARKQAEAYEAAWQTKICEGKLLRQNSIDKKWQYPLTAVRSGKGQSGIRVEWKNLDIPPTSCEK